jgi:hypothetical protein
MDPAELELRSRIMASFAATGSPPPVDDGPSLRGLVERHVVVLSGDGEVVMAHPFAGHRRGARVDAGGRTWWGNCSWDAFGIVAALGLREARVTDASGLEVAVEDGEPRGDAVFHVAVPARDWWADIGFT